MKLHTMNFIENGKKKLKLDSLTRASKVCQITSLNVLE